MTEEAKSKFIIDSEFIQPPKGLIVTNFVFDEEPVFKHRPRKEKLKHFVLHETAGRTASGCKRTLQKKGYGVHLIMARDGSISCHGDLALDVMTHANQLNKTSIGIEVVNPYAPRIARGMNVNFIPAKWWTWCPDKHDRRYVLPSKKQLEALQILVPFLCEQLGIPYEFPTADISKKKPKVDRVGWAKKRIPAAGVVAHQDFAKHADGRYLIEYLMENQAQI